MSRQAACKARRGTSAIEFAVSCPIAFFLLFSIIVGGLGAFRYQQVAALAREAARWASVHGGEYERETGQPAATAQDVYDTIIQPSAVALELNRLSHSVTWDSDNEPLSINGDYEVPVGNTVTVTVTYEWFPEMYVMGPLTLTSASTAQMLY